MAGIDTRGCEHQFCTSLDRGTKAIWLSQQWGNHVWKSGKGWPEEGWPRPSCTQQQGDVLICGGYFMDYCLWIASGFCGFGHTG